MAGSGRTKVSDTVGKIETCVKAMGVNGAWGVPPDTGWPRGLSIVSPRASAGLQPSIRYVGGGIQGSSRINGIPKSASATMGLRTASREGGVPGGVVDLIEVAGLEQLFASSVAGDEATEPLLS